MEVTPATPVVTVLVNGAHIDITYACEFDHATQKITLPDNLPEASEVYVDYEHHIHTTPVSITSQLRTLPRKERPFKRNLLAACIGAILGVQS